MSKFHTNLVALLRNETSYTSPVGGPYLRHADGSAEIPSKPDGLAFDDDPKDTGGRTCMGITQSEYDAFRVHHNLPAQDVWRIQDAEIDGLYYAQYWAPMRCEELPAGVDFAVFDAGVNCGIGMGAKFLQRALGVKVDGHIGMQTLGAAKMADPETLLEAVTDARRAYHRSCRTFKAHGKGWLARCDVVQGVCQMMASAPVTIDQPPLALVAQDSRKALPPEPPTSVAETKTGQSAVVSGSTGAGLSFAGVIAIYQQADASGLLSAQNLMPLAIIVAGLVLSKYAHRDWMDRGRKLILGA